MSGSRESLAARYTGTRLEGAFIVARVARALRGIFAVEDMATGCPVVVRGEPGVRGCTR